MMSLLSSISGKFATPVLLGTTFPLIVFSSLAILIIAPMDARLKALGEVIQKAAVDDKAWSVVALSVVVIVVSGLFYNMNIPIIRLYEGYPWGNSWLGKALIKYRSQRLVQARDLRLAIRNTRRELRRLNPNHALLADLYGPQTALARYLKWELPASSSSVLPTKLGNVIRSFENYPHLVYGIDSVVLWPHLLPKINSTLAAALDDSKTAFDFMLNSSFLSSLCALGVLVVAASAPVFVPREEWIWRAALFAVVAWIFYEFATNRAAAWGTHVRAAFDVHRIDMLKGFGYEAPATRAEERAIWRSLSLELLFADDYEGIRVDFNTRVIPIPTPEGVVLSAKRKYETAKDDTLASVVIENVDPAKRKATEVTVIDVLTEGFKYVPKTLGVNSGSVTLVRLKPFTYQLDALAPGASVTVTYQLKSGT